MHKIEKIAWNTFKNTGNIDTFLEMKQVETLEETSKKVKIDGEKNETNQNERDSFSRE